MNNIERQLSCDIEEMGGYNGMEIDLPHEKQS